MKRIMQCILLVFLVAAGRGNAKAQTGPLPDSSQSFIGKNVSINGVVGAYGQMYGISGIPGRLPPSLARLYFQPTVTLFHAFSMSFDFLLSTEGSSARQNINQLGVNPSWGWGDAHLGDFSSMFTPLTFDGILVRGAGINLHPGVFRFSAVGGYTQRAVSGGPGIGSYSRYMYGARIGVGKQEGSYFDISFLRTRDNPSSLPSPHPTVVIIAPNGNDAWPIGNIETITWASAGIYGNVRIEISRDGGSTYQVLFDSVVNTGSQTWLVTGPPTSEALIRITSLQDSVSSVSQFPFTIGSGIQEQQGTTPGILTNSFAVTPQENLVSGADGRLALFDNVLTIKGELDGSVYTRNMNATEVDSIGLPKALTGIYAPRSSSSADYAYNAQVGLNLQTFNARIGYQYIGPGYTSLGVASLLPDQRQITLATMLRLSRVSISLNAGHQNDNLLGQKSYTTNRNQVAGNISLPFSRQWTTTLMGSYMNMANNASSDTFKVAYSTLMAGMTQMIFVGPGSFFQMASLNYTFQNSANNNPLQQGSGMVSHSANLSISLNAAAGLVIMPALSLIASKIGETGWTSTQSYSISAQDRAFENRLNSSLSLGLSRVQGASSLQIGFSSDYGITGADAIVLTVMETLYTGTTKFSEHTIGLNLSHTF